MQKERQERNVKSVSRTQLLLGKEGMDALAGAKVAIFWHLAALAAMW